MVTLQEIISFLNLHYQPSLTFQHRPSPSCQTSSCSIAHIARVLEMAKERKRTRLPGLWRHRIRRDKLCSASICSYEGNHWHIKCEIWETAGLLPSIYRFTTQPTSPGWFGAFFFRITNQCSCRSQNINPCYGPGEGYFKWWPKRRMSDRILNWNSDFSVLS